MDSFQPSPKFPIPQPSYPLQYRAIGLIRGKYQTTDSKINRGWLVDKHGKPIKAVILGRIMGLLKSRLDLNQEYFWVVYPHLKATTDELQLQIIGIWEPPSSLEDPSAWDGQFSIRGEVIAAYRRDEVVIVKIRRNETQGTSKRRFYKLKLQGKLSEKPMGHFWDFQVNLHGEHLVIEKASDLGKLTPKPPEKPILKPKEKEETSPSTVRRKRRRASSRNLPHFD